MFSIHFLFTYNEVGTSGKDDKIIKTVTYDITGCDKCLVKNICHACKGHKILDTVKN